MTTIQLQIKDCSECPKHTTKRTPHSGYANDYYCTLTWDKVGSYIEWLSEMPEVPENCPIRFNG